VISRASRVGAGRTCRPRSGLDREAGAAAAGGGGVGVLDLEGGADQLVGEVDLGASHVGQRDGINQDGGAVALDDDVVGLACRDQIESILETRSAAAVHADTEERVGGIRGGDFRNALGGAFGQGYVHRSVPVARAEHVRKWPVIPIR
jgi:hypothetical protein